MSSSEKPPALHSRGSSRSAKRLSNPSPKSSPKRQPLHERSKSQTNELVKPTIRLVEDAPANIYQKSPFPTVPSQILAPRKVPGYVFEDRSGRALNERPISKTILDYEALVPKALQTRKPDRTSSSTATSEADTATNTSPFSPSSSRFSEGTLSTPPASLKSNWDGSKVGDLGLGAEKLPRSTSAKETHSIRTVLPSGIGPSHGPASQSASVLAPGHKLRLSDASLASSASSETLGGRQHEDRRGSRSSSVASPPPKSAHRSAARGKKHTTSTNKGKGKAPQASTDSLPYSIISYDSSIRPRSSSSPSHPVHSAQKVTLQSGVPIQYPVIKPPSASGSWADTSLVFPKNSSRMIESRQRPHQYPLRLSTVPSEPERLSGRLSHHSRHLSQSSRDSVPPIRERRKTDASMAPSGENPSTSDSSVPTPLPLFSDQPHRNGIETDEGDDTIGELQTPQLRAQRSGYFSVHSRDSRPGSAAFDRSYILPALPAWTRVYYSRTFNRSSILSKSSSQTSLSSHLPTAQSSLGPSASPASADYPAVIYHPRKRPFRSVKASRPPGTATTTNTLDISEANLDIRDDEDELQQTSTAHEPPTRGVAPRRTPLHNEVQPRLRQDGRSEYRLSTWRPPSLDEAFETLDRRNRQVLLFALGFILPFAWMIAAFLPLPPMPTGGISKEATPNQTDVERAIAQDVAPLEQKHYQKARWWRNLNRSMSVVGVLIIVAIIALAVTAPK